MLCILEVNITCLVVVDVFCVVSKWSYSVFSFFFVDSYHTVAAETLLEQFLHVEEDNSFGVLSSKW